MSRLTRAPVTRLTRLASELRASAIAGAEDYHPANVPQFFAKFSAPRSDTAKIV